MIKCTITYSKKIINLNYYIRLINKIIINSSNKHKLLRNVLKIQLVKMICNHKNNKIHMIK